MAIRKIKNSWWADFRFGRKRYRKRSPENSRAGASAYEASLKTRLARGEKIDGQDSEKRTMTFSEFSKKWFDCYVLTNNKPSEQLHKKSALNAHLVPFFGKTPLTDISNRQIEEFKATRIKAGSSEKTVNNLTAILAKCLATAVEWELLEKVPQIRKLKVPPYKFDFLTKNEEEKLVAAAHGVWKEMIIFAVDTGVRLGELAALDWASVNLSKKEIAIRKSFTVKHMLAPKSNRERYIPMTQRVCDMLIARENKIGLIFCVEPNRPLLQNRCLNSLLRICQKAGLRPLKWHTLRHTLATRLISNGGSVKAVQELLGHSDIKTTMRYAHLEPNVLKDTIGILDKLQNFGQPVGNQAKNQEKNICFSAPQKTSILAE